MPGYGWPHYSEQWSRAERDQNCPGFKLAAIACDADNSSCRWSDLGGPIENGNGVGDSVGYAAVEVFADACSRGFDSILEKVTVRLLVVWWFLLRFTLRVVLPTSWESNWRSKNPPSTVHRSLESSGVTDEFWIFLPRGLAFQFVNNFFHDASVQPK
jgi:preprotein translocase subunit SecG